MRVLKKRVFRGIAILLVAVLVLDQIPATALETLCLGRSTLSPWASSDGVIGRRKILAKMYRDSRLIQEAKSTRYRDYLDENSAEALLLPSGKYLVDGKVLKNDLLLLEAITQEDYKLLIQYQAKIDPEWHEDLMRQVVSDESLLLSYYDLPNSVTEEDGMVLFNDLVSKGLELIFLADNGYIYPVSELTENEKTFMANVRSGFGAKCEAGTYKNFPEYFSDISKRQELVGKIRSDKDFRAKRVSPRTGDSKSEDPDTLRKRLKERIDTWTRKGIFVLSFLALSTVLGAAEVNSSKPSKTFLIDPKNDRKVESIFKEYGKDKISYKKYTEFLYELADIKDFRSFQYLVLNIFDDNNTPYIKERAIEGLGRLGDVRAFFFLLKAEENAKAESVRRKATKTIEKYGYRESVEALIFALINTGSQESFDKIFAVLEELDDIKVIDGLSSAMRNDPYAISCFYIFRKYGCFSGSLKRAQDTARKAYEKLQNTTSPKINNEFARREKVRVEAQEKKRLAREKRLQEEKKSKIKKLIFAILGILGFGGFLVWIIKLFKSIPSNQPVQTFERDSSGEVYTVSVNELGLVTKRNVREEPRDDLPSYSQRESELRYRLRRIRGRHGSFDEMEDAYEEKASIFKKKYNISMDRGEKLSYGPVDSGMYKKAIREDFKTVISLAANIKTEAKSLEDSREKYLLAKEKREKEAKELGYSGEFEEAVLSRESPVDKRYRRYFKMKADAQVMYERMNASAESIICQLLAQKKDWMIKKKAAPRFFSAGLKEGVRVGELIEFFGAIQMINDLYVHLVQDRIKPKTYEEARDKWDLDFEKYSADLLAIFKEVEFDNDVDRDKSVKFLSGIACGKLDYPIYVRQAAVVSLQKAGTADAKAAVEEALKDNDMLVVEVRVENTATKDEIKKEILDSVAFLAGDPNASNASGLGDNIDYAFERIPEMAEFLRHYPLRLYKLKHEKTAKIGEYKHYWMRVQAYAFYLNMNYAAIPQLIPKEAFRSIVIRHRDSPIDMGMAVELFNHKHLLASVFYHEYLHYEGEYSEGKVFLRQIIFLKKILAEDGLLGMQRSEDVEKALLRGIAELGLISLVRFLALPLNRKYLREMNKYILAVYGPDDMNEEQVAAEADRIINDIRSYIARENEELKKDPNKALYEPLTREAEEEIRASVSRSSKIVNAVGKWDFFKEKSAGRGDIGLWKKYLRKGGGSVVKTGIEGVIRHRYAIRGVTAREVTIMKPKDFKHGKVDEYVEVHPALDAAANEGRMFAAKMSEVDDMIGEEAAVFVPKMVRNLVNIRDKDNVEQEMMKRVVSSEDRDNLLRGFDLMKKVVKGDSDAEADIRFCIVFEEDDQPAIIFNDRHANLVAHTGRGEKTDLPYSSVYIGYNLLKYAIDNGREEDFQEIIRHEVKDMVRGYHGDEDMDAMEGFYEDYITTYFSGFNPVVEAFGDLERAAKETNLNRYGSVLAGLSQKAFGCKIFRFCLPVEVFKTAPDTMIALRRIGGMAKGPDQVEVMITGVDESDAELVDKLNNGTFKTIFDISDNIELIPVYEKHIQEKIVSEENDADGTLKRVQAIKTIINEMNSSGDDGYVFISEVVDNKADGDLLAEALGKQVEDNASYRILIRAKAGKGVFSISNIINSYLRAVWNGDTSTISVILPVVLTPEEMIKILTEKTTAAWKVLTSV